MGNAEVRIGLTGTSWEYPALIHENSSHWTGRENLHMVWNHGLPLGVQCKGCARRAVVPLDRVRAERGDMKPVKALKLVCSKCGSNDWLATIFTQDCEVEAIVALPVGSPTF